MRKIILIVAAYVMLSLVTATVTKYAAAQYMVKPPSPSPQPCILAADSFNIDYVPHQYISGITNLYCTNGTSSGCYGTLQANLWYNDPVIGWYEVRTACQDYGMKCNVGPNEAGSAFDLTNVPLGNYYFECAISTGSCQFPGQIISWDYLYFTEMR